MNFKEVHQNVLHFPEVETKMHFEKVALKVRKKIFLTHLEGTTQLTLKFSKEDQNLLIGISPENIFPVPNKWGNQGWTLVNFEKLENEVLLDLLKAAYCAVAPEKLAQEVLPKK